MAIASNDGGSGGGSSPSDAFPDPGNTHHVMQIGQSNSVGADSVPPVTVASFTGLSMLTPLAAAVSGSDGIRAPQARLVSAGEYTSLVPLAEAQVVDNYKDVDVATGHFTGAALPYSFGETALASMLNDVRSHHSLFVGAASSCGVLGMSYSRLKKGTDPYENGMTQLRAVRDLTSGTYPSRVFALTAQHGEADVASSTYAADLQQWLSDWTADIRAAIPAQTRDPILILIQISYYADKTSALQMLVATLAQPRILIAFPVYAVGGAFAPHRTALAQRWSGAYFAKAYRAVMLGQSWQIVRPLSAVLVSNTVTVTFNVPVAPLVFDTPTGGSLLAAKGFEFVDDSSSATVSSAVIAGSTVVVTLSGVPSGTNKRIKYAIAGNFGNLRDSDPAIGLWGDKLYNWCVHFDMGVT